MNDARRPFDHAARAAAATRFAANLVVSAGAGTGKTSLLVERVLNAIGAGIAPLPAIAAITFTDKAAGELRHRLASGLDELAACARGNAGGDRSSEASRTLAHLLSQGVGAKEIAEHAAEALARLDRAAVTTIHGFCADVLRAYPLESGVPPGFAVERGAGARRVAREAWEAFLGEELGPSGQRAEIWRRVLDAIPLAEVEEVALALAGGAIPDAVLDRDIASFDLRAVRGEWAATLADTIAEAVRLIPGLTAAPREWLEEAESALRVFSRDGTAAARRLIERARRIPESMPNVRTKKVPDDAAELLLSLGGKARPLLRGLAAIDDVAAAAVFAAVLPFARRHRERNLRAGAVDFDALLVRTRDLLRDDPAVRESLKRRFSLILLDEFQDTDPIQYEIVFFAAERAGESGRDAYATRLAPGKLFIVGDAKQSIYRFRGADFAAYRRAVAHVLGQGGEELSLTSNFRSLPGVIDPINALFEGPGSPSWRESSYLPRYEPIRAERDGGLLPAVEVWTAGAVAGASSADRRLAEGRALAEELAAIAGSGGPAGYGDVLVLFRAFSNVALYLRALREAGIPFVVSGGRTFAERTEIVQAMAVLRTVADPRDEVALLAYLRSPAGGVPDTELASHAARRRPWSVDAEVDARACPALAAALTRLAGLREDARHLPVGTSVRHVLERSGLFFLSGLAFEASQRVANLEKLVQSAGELARDGRLTLDETLGAIEDSPEFGEEGDSPLADETVDAVRVMTIHAAKGLEAKVVVLADAAAERNHRPAHEWKARMASLPGGAFVRFDGPSMRNAAAVEASLEDARHDEGEHLRLLYVALTRARDRLIVFGGGTRSTPWIEALAAWGYDPKAVPEDNAVIGSGKVLHRLVAVRRGARRPAVPAAVGAPGAVARYETAVAAVARLAAPPFRSPSRCEDHGGESRDRVEGALSPELAREVGSIVHARLSRIPLTAGSDEAKREFEAVMAAFDRSPLAVRLASLQVLGREVPVLLDEGAARWRGVIDLIYRDEDGTVVVADYKTDASADGAIERHGPQLAVYVRALKRAMPGVRVRAELWMVRSGSVLEL